MSGETGLPTVELTAQWALWGKGADERTYRVLASSTGDFTAWDFANLAERYASGTADRLPQYTVFWVPDSEGAPWFVGLAIHEHASYTRQDDRRHFDASGREILYSRLFCVRYADLAAHGVTFTELASAVEELSLQNLVTPVTLRITPERSRQPPSPGPAADTGPGLAEVVAALLLTTRQVCVLAADEVPAPERLAFIDQVLSLLPYGLRATLSAATWASPTARDLKLRLFFASARRDDNSRTYHVYWDKRGQSDDPVPDVDVSRRYLDWLRGTGAQAEVLLTGQTSPLRFSHADIRAMMAMLPGDLTMTDILDDLARSLREGDAAASKRAALRFKLHPVGPVHPADHDRYRDQVIRHGLLDNHPKLKQGSQAQIYQKLLRLSFEMPLSYRSYCTIEDAIGSPPRGTLRLTLLDLTIDNYVPWLLIAKGEPRVEDEVLVTALAGMSMAAARPLTDFQRNLADIRPAHRATLYDFALHYLRAQAEDPRAELMQRGYLAETLAAIFPEEPAAQRIRLEDYLLFVRGASFSRGQIRDLFREPDLRPTAAFEAAVARLATAPEADRLIAEQAAQARIRSAGNGDKHASNGAESKPDLRRWHVLFRRRDADPSDPLR